MVATDKLFAGSIPEIYDRFMVPLIFEVYARDLADRLAKAGATGSAGNSRRDRRSDTSRRRAASGVHAYHRDGSQSADA